MLHRQLFLLLCGIAVIEGCKNLTGSWINKKGSVLTIDHHQQHLHGFFDTAVESKEGSAGNGPVHIRGFTDPNGLVTFSVKYKDSVASFSGQCFENGLKETIQITWLLTSKAENCEDHWMSTRVGQDRFVRKTHSVSVHKLSGS